MAGKKKADAASLSDEEQLDVLVQAAKGRSAREILEWQKTLRSYQTGCHNLDLAFGRLDPITGLPGFGARDKIECFGPYMSLKTALMENAAINVLNSDPDAKVLLILAEEGDIARMANRGADLDRVTVLGFYDPDVEQHWRNAETVLRNAVQFAKQRIVNKKTSKVQTRFTGVDSWAQLTLQLEVEDKDGEQRDYQKVAKVGAHAQLTQTFLKDWGQHNFESALWINNQIRDFIPTNKFAQFEDGMRVRTPGGNAFRHAMDWRISLYAKKVEADKENQYTKRKLGEGLLMSWKMIKQKLPRKYADKSGQNTFWFDPPGFDEAEALIPFLDHYGLIEKSGPAHFIINDQKFHGRDNLIHYLDSNPELVTHLFKQVAQLNQEETFYGGEDRPSASLR